MTENNKFCENCRHYEHRKNIIGGITECLLDIKALNSFWRNDACDKYDEVRTNEIPSSLINLRSKETIQQIKSEDRKDKAWEDLGNTLRDMGNDEPEF